MSYLKGLADKVNRVEAKSSYQLLEIDIDKLIPSKSNYFGIREIEELATSIKESGLLHNLVVRRTSDGYEILSGERRYRALKSLGYEKVPCQVRTIRDLDAEILLIKANTEHRELSQTEKMQSIKRLKEIYDLKRANGEELPKGKTRDLIGKEVGMSGVQVGRYLKVDNKLIEPLKEDLNKGNITLTQAEIVSNLKETEQEEIHHKVNDKSIGKEEVDLLIEGIKQPVKTEKDKDLLQELTNHYFELEKEIIQSKKPRVVITSKGYCCIVNIKKISKVPQGNLINIHTEDMRDAFIANLTQLKVVYTIPSLKGDMKPKRAFEINEGIYVWL